MKKLLILACLLFAFASLATAQKAYEPKKGTAERSAIMNAIRSYDIKRNAELEGETFNVSALRVQGTWAYANIEQTPPSGVSSYGQAHIFLRRSGGSWNVEFSTYNDNNEVAVDGLARLRKSYRSFPSGLAGFAMKYLAG